jgi:hypothetical protein
MSFWKKLFGGSEGAAPAASEPLKEIEHKGFLIRATPFQEGREYQTCGVVSKEIDGVLKEHRFIRADRFSDAGTAADIALTKGRQLVDEQGDRLFS